MFAAELVKERRKAAGFSARTFGLAIGVTGRNVRRYEAGEVEPPLSTAGLMARALGISIDDLYVHEPEGATTSNGHGEHDDESPAQTDSPVAVRPGVTSAGSRGGAS